MMDPHLSPDRRPGSGARATAGGGFGAIILAGLMGLTPGPAWSADAFCSATANALYRACCGEVVDDYWTTLAKCTNLTDARERSRCEDDATASRTEGKELCSDQLQARRAACLILGEARYDPEREPIDFDSDYTSLTNPNPYFPLTIGHRWEYRGGTEFNSVEILDRTKRIDGITCIVGRDQVFDAGDLTEDTDDWFCQARSGAVWYFGEETKQMESFDGDIPRLPEIVGLGQLVLAPRPLSDL